MSHVNLTVLLLYTTSHVLIIGYFRSGGAPMVDAAGAEGAMSTLGTAGIATKASKASFITNAAESGVAPDGTTSVAAALVGIVFLGFLGVLGEFGVNAARPGSRRLSSTASLRICSFLFSRFCRFPSRLVDPVPCTSLHMPSYNKRATELFFLLLPNINAY